ncbi:MAG: NYN domain-containing protein [Christensenellaceae bacterium]
MLNIFRSLARSKRAMVFVDYEYWFYSYKNKYNLRPDTAAWRAELEKQFDIEDIMIFADFSSPGIGEELAKLRNITNTIIETGTATQYRKKDMTDFVMLDYIYQNVTSRNDVGTYIIFTGDGHFQSVVKYLVQKRHKKVVVYGVTDTFSKRLQGVASDIRLLPDEEELNNSYMRMIVSNLAHVETKANIIPTFWGTIEAVSKRNNVPDDRVKATLLRMMANGYVFQKDFSINSQTGAHRCRRLENQSSRPLRRRLKQPAEIKPAGAASAEFAQRLLYLFKLSSVYCLFRFFCFTKVVYCSGESSSAASSSALFCGAVGIMPVVSFAEAVASPASIPKFCPQKSASCILGIFRSELFLSFFISFFIGFTSFLFAAE